MTQDEIKKKSHIIAEILYNLDEFTEASSVFIYVNYNQEVETISIIKKCLELGKNVFVPKVHGDVILFHQIKNIEKDLTLGAYGILEPSNEQVDYSHSGLLIMPGVAFDREHHRIGYGGGFYDKYLEAANQHHKVALAYGFQVLDMIDTNNQDIKVDCIITENGIL